MVKCLPEFEYFTVFLKNKNIMFKIRRSKVTDYAALTIKILNDFILWVMFLKANTCIPSLCESKILTELRFKHQELSGENNIYRLANKYSLLKTRFRNDNSYF